MEFRKGLVTVNASRLARVLGVNPSTVWRWKEGISKPTRRHREKVERVLGEFAAIVLPELRGKTGPRSTTTRA
jgi:transcriptional regulator with XRE-family HTH domain